MGRSAKTDKEKKVLGTDREDRKRYTKKKKGKKKYARSPIELGDFGKKVFKEVKEYLEEAGLLWEVDYVIISQYSYFAEIFKGTAERMNASEDPYKVYYDSGAEGLSADYQILVSAKKNMADLAKVLGLGPYFRQSIRAFDEEPAEVDEVADMIKEMNEDRGE